MKALRDIALSVAVFVGILAVLASLPFLMTGVIAVFVILALVLVAYVIYASIHDTRLKREQEANSRES